VAQVGKKRPVGLVHPGLVEARVHPLRVPWQFWAEKGLS